MGVKNFLGDRLRYLLKLWIFLWLVISAILICSFFTLILTLSVLWYHIGWTKFVLFLDEALQIRELDPYILIYLLSCAFSLISYVTIILLSNTNYNEREILNYFKGKYWPLESRFLEYFLG